MVSTNSSVSTVDLFDAINVLKKHGIYPWQVIDSVLGAAISTGLESYLTHDAHKNLMNADPNDLITMIHLVYSHDHTYNLPASIIRHLNVLHRSGRYTYPYSLMIDWSYGYVAEDSESEKIIARWLKRFTFSTHKNYQRRLSVYLYLQARVLGL